MQVNKSFSVRGSAVLYVSIENCYAVSGESMGDRRAVTLVARNFDNVVAGTLPHRMTLTLNMDRYEQGVFARLILGDRDPFLNLARVVADLKANEMTEDAIATLITQARVALGRE